MFTHNTLKAEGLRSFKVWKEFPCAVSSFLLATYLWEIIITIIANMAIAKMEIIEFLFMVLEFVENNNRILNGFSNSELF